MERKKPSATTSTATTSNPDWLALPAGVLQHVFAQASAFQLPGSCLAALVCSTWRTAAAGCRGIRLLYHSGSPAANASFVTWLGSKSQQLEALTLGDSSRGDEVGPVLGALADAAAAAEAAGAPLQLHTLRVLSGGCDLATAGRLLAALPHLECLQLAPRLPKEKPSAGAVSQLVQETLGPLKKATQLQQLYLGGPGAVDALTGRGITAAVAELLPLSLKRLSWLAPGYTHVPNLSFQTQLTFLRLYNWPIADQDRISARLPPSLQEFEILRQLPAVSEQLEEPPHAVTAWATSNPANVQQQLSRLTNLRRLSLDLGCVQVPAVRKALAQHTKLVSVAVQADRLEYVDVDDVMAAVASISNLNSLDLSLSLFCSFPGEHLDALTGVTRLSMRLSDEYRPEHALSMVAMVGHDNMAGLRRLSLSGKVMSAGCATRHAAWLGGMSQLRVLSVHFWDSRPSYDRAGMQWLLDWCSQGTLPPKLQLLEVTGLTAAREGWHLRHSLREKLSSSGCELVVGGHRDDAADDDLVQRLAGMPAALQQLFT